MSFTDDFTAHTKSNIGYLHLYDEKTQEISLNVWGSGVIAFCETGYDQHYPLDKAGVWADCIRQRRPVIHNDYKPSLDGKSLPKGHFPLSSHCSFPIIYQQQIVAIIGIGNRIRPYAEQEVSQLWAELNLNWPHLLESLSLNSPDFQSAQGGQYSTKSSLEMVIDAASAIARAIEVKDEYTSSHQSSVAKISNEIATVMGLDDDVKRGLRLGASIHDVGKIVIPASILNKRTPLTKAEFDVVKRHPEVGATILRDVVLPWPIAEMVYQHHERLDGTGYPRGLDSRELLLEARIIAVADTYDAMSSSRPYRIALGKKAAVEVLRAGRGKVFDSYVVDAFLSLSDLSNY